MWYCKYAIVYVAESHIQGGEWLQHFPSAAESRRGTFVPAEYNTTFCMELQAFFVKIVNFIKVL